MSAGRRRMWWRHIRVQKEIKAESVEEAEEEDGRLKSEGSKGRVPSKGHVERSYRPEI